MGFSTEKYTQSPFLKGHDLEEGERTVATITNAEEVEFPSGDTVPVLEFRELDQKLTLNKTRVKKLVEVLGDDTDEWIGRKISIYRVDVQFQGKTMPGVAVGAPPKAKKAAAKAEPEPEQDVEFMQREEKEDDEDPF